MSERSGRAEPDVVWVGLGMPKQELWMDRVHTALPGMTLVGVGAVFDWVSGTVRKAPRWMQDAGLEWLFRLGQEPGGCGAATPGTTPPSSSCARRRWYVIAAAGSRRSRSDVRIAVFGLGYVGTVSAACLARDGRFVFGVDPNTTKVDLVNQGIPPLIEAGVDRLMAEGVASGRIIATSECKRAVLNSDLAIVAVGTPSQPNGDIDLSHVRRVMEEIGAWLRVRDGFYVVSLRSTVLPGTTARTVIPALETASGKRAGSSFGVCANPEFLPRGLGPL